VTLGDGWLSREAADYDELAASVESIHAACVRHGRDPSTVASAASLTATADWNAATSIDELTERAVDRGTSVDRYRRHTLHHPAQLLPIDLGCARWAASGIAGGLTRSHGDFLASVNAIVEPDQAGGRVRSCSNVRICF